MRGGNLINCLLSDHIVIANPVLYVVCLPINEIGQYLVLLEYFLEHLSSFFLILPLPRIEIRMVIICKLKVCELDFLGWCSCLHSLLRIEVYRIFLEIEHYRSSGQLYRGESGIGKGHS